MSHIDGLAVPPLPVRAGITELGFAIPTQKLKNFGEALIK